MQLADIFPWGNNASQLCRALDDEKLLCEVFSGSERYPMRAAFYSVAGDLKTRNILPLTVKFPAKLADDQLAGPFLVQMLADPQARQQMATQSRLWKNLVGIDAPFSEVLGSTLKKWFDDPSYAHSAPAWSNCLVKDSEQGRHLQFSLKAFENLLKSVDNPLKRTSYHRFMVLVATFAIVDPEQSIWIVSKILHKFPKVATWVAPYGATEAQIAGLVKQATALVQPGAEAPSIKPAPVPASPLIPAEPAPVSQPMNIDHSGSSQDLLLRLSEWSARAQQTAKSLQQSADALARLQTPSDTVSLIQSLSQLHNDAKNLIDDVKLLAVHVNAPDVNATHPSELEAILLQIQRREQEQRLIAQKHQAAHAILTRIASLAASSESDAKALIPLQNQAAQMAITLAVPASITDTAELDQILAPTHPFSCVLALLEHDAGLAESQLDDTQLDACDTTVIAAFGIGFQRKLHQGKFIFSTPVPDAQPAPRATQFA